MTGLGDVCGHCGKDLGEHLVPSSKCPTPGLKTYFLARPVREAAVRAEFSGYKEGSGR